MGAPVQVKTPNPDLRNFNSDLVDRTSHKMNPKSDSFKQIQIEAKINTADISTSENSTTNIGFFENGIWSQVSSNNNLEPLLIE